MKHIVLTYPRSHITHYLFKCCKFDCSGTLRLNLREKKVDAGSSNLIMFMYVFDVIVCMSMGMCIGVRGRVLEREFVQV